MENKKVNKLVNNEEHTKLIKLFSEHSPEERSKLLNDIDNILCGMLDLKPSDLPWISPNKHTDKWSKIMKNLRLVVGRLEYESFEKDRTVH
jgi:hypothetical protein